MTENNTKSVLCANIPFQELEEGHTYIILIAEGCEWIKQYVYCTPGEYKVFNLVKKWSFTHQTLADGRFSISPGGFSYNQAFYKFYLPEGHKVTQYPIESITYEALVNFENVPCPTYKWFHLYELKVDNGNQIDCRYSGRCENPNASKCPCDYVLGHLNSISLEKEKTMLLYEVGVVSRKKPVPPATEGEIIGLHAIELVLASSLKDALKKRIDREPERLKCDDVFGRAVEYTGL